MGYKVTTDVWRQSAQKGSTLLLALAIADHCDDDGLAWPGLTLQAAKTRLSIRQVQRLNRELCLAGEMIRFSQHDLGKRTFSLLLHGMTIANLRSAIGKLEMMAGNDILTRAYPKNWIPVLRWLSRLGESPLDNMTIPLVKMSRGVDIAVSWGLDIAVSTESSIIVMNQSPNGDSAAKAAQSQVMDDLEAEAFIGDSRIPSGTESSLEEMAPEQRAQVGSPAQAPRQEDASEPYWIQLLRKAGARYTYRWGFVQDDIVALCSRISERGGIAPPALLSEARKWHAGGVALLDSFQRQFTEGKEYPPTCEGIIRRANWCIDLFFLEDGPLSFITATSPHSLISSTGKLVGELEAMSEYFGLTLNLPGPSQIEHYYNEKGDTNVHRGSTRQVASDGAAIKRALTADPAPIGAA